MIAQCWKRRLGLPGRWQIWGSAEVERRVKKGGARLVLMLGSKEKTLRWLLEVQVTTSPAASTKVKAF